MTPENFCFWLQGLFEMSDVKTLNETQVKIIKEHLHLVFNGVTETKIEQQPFVQQVTVAGTPPLGASTTTSPFVLSKELTEEERIKRLIEAIGKVDIGKTGPEQTRTTDPWQGPLVGTGKGAVIC